MECWVFVVVIYDALCVCGAVVSTSTIVSLHAVTPTMIFFEDLPQFLILRNKWDIMRCMTSS